MGRHAIIRVLCFNDTTQHTGRGATHAASKFLDGFLVAPTAVRRVGLCRLNVSGALISSASTAHAASRANRATRTFPVGVLRAW